MDKNSFDDTKIHCLKTWPQSFHDVKHGRKTFEIRKNDREFNVKDILILQEYKIPSEQYTGEMIAVKVTYIVRSGFGLPEDLCVMGIERI